MRVIIEGSDKKVQAAMKLLRNFGVSFHDAPEPVVVSDFPEDSKPVKRKAGRPKSK